MWLPRLQHAPLVHSFWGHVLLITGCVRRAREAEQALGFVTSGRNQIEMTLLDKTSRSNLWHSCLVVLVDKLYMYPENDRRAIRAKSVAIHT